MAIDKALIDQLLKDYKRPEEIIGENGLLKQLTKAVLERALEAEMTEHLGYEKHDTFRRHFAGIGQQRLDPTRQRGLHVLLGFLEAGALHSDAPFLRNSDPAVILRRKSALDRDRSRHTQAERMRGHDRHSVYRGLLSTDPSGGVPLQRTMGLSRSWIESRTETVVW
jgi:hypothetical protein